MRFSCLATTDPPDISVSDARTNPLTLTESAANDTRLSGLALRLRAPGYYWRLFRGTRLHLLVYGGFHTICPVPVFDVPLQVAEQVLVQLLRTRRDEWLAHDFGTAVRALQAWSQEDDFRMTATLVEPLDERAAMLLLAAWTTECELDADPRRTFAEYVKAALPMSTHPGRVEHAQLQLDFATNRAWRSAPANPGPTGMYELWADEILTWVNTLHAKIVDRPLHAFVKILEHRLQDLERAALQDLMKRPAELRPPRKQVLPYEPEQLDNATKQATYSKPPRAGVQARGTSPIDASIASVYEATHYLEDRLENRTLIDDVERLILYLIFEAGLSLEGVAEVLNELEIRNAKGEAWIANSVNQRKDRALRALAGKPAERDRLAQQWAEAAFTLLTFERFDGLSAKFHLVDSLKKYELARLIPLLNPDDALRFVRRIGLLDRDELRALEVKYREPKSVSPKGGPTLSSPDAFDKAKSQVFEWDEQLQQLRALFLRQQLRHQNEGQDEDPLCPDDEDLRRAIRDALERKEVDAKWVVKLREVARQCAARRSPTKPEADAISAKVEEHRNKTKGRRDS